jgi:DNA-binding transcriptional LysR family regulator
LIRYISFPDYNRDVDLLAAMRAFVTIVDTGSLTAAAAALDRAPPTMVRTLATLEEELGIRLLIRTTRKMALTEEGRVYLDRCRRILADVEEAAHAIASSDAEPHGEIRVTAPVLFGQRHVAPAITRFVRRYARVDVDLLLLDRVVNLVEEGLDVGIRIGRLQDSSMIAVPVGHVRRVVVASPDFLAKSGRVERPEELPGRPCVVHHGSATGGRWTFREPASPRHEPRAISVSSRFASNQATAVVDACAAGLGYGCFLSYQVEPEVRAGRLEVILEEFEPDPLPVQIVYPDARLMSSRLRCFVDAMKVDLKARPEIQSRVRLQERREQR